MALLRSQVLADGCDAGLFGGSAWSVEAETELEVRRQPALKLRCLVMPTNSGSKKTVRARWVLWITDYIQ